MANTSYVFHYADNNIDTIHINIEPLSYNIIIPADYTPPACAKLEYNKCRNCTLNADSNTYCPVAKNISFLFSGLSTKHSYEKVDLEVITTDRSYSSSTTMQRALGSMLGLIFSLSDCPGTTFLKPMGMFHLPLSTEMDTLTRTFSFFILSKFFEYYDNEITSIDLNDLVLNYKNLRSINQDFSKRLRMSSKTDASLNAIVLLDLLAQNVDFELDEEFDKLKKIFGRQYVSPAHREQNNAIN